VILLHNHGMFESPTFVTYFASREISPTQQKELVE